MKEKRPPDKQKRNFEKKISELLDVSRNVLSSFNVLFQYPEGTALKITDVSEKEIITLFLSVLHSIENELSLLKDDISAYKRIRKSVSHTPIAGDFINHLILNTENKPVAKILERAVSEILNYKVFFQKEPRMEEIIFYVSHADVVCRQAPGLIREYMKILIEIEKEFSLASFIFTPQAEQLLASSELFMLPASESALRERMEELKSYAKASDRFSESRAFRYIDETFFPAELRDIRSLDRFFGYHSARQKIRRYFLSFVKEDINHPLFISSLPGLGKTHMTIAYTLFFKELTLILPEPENIEKPLERLIRTLSVHKNRKFVIFFDDVDPRNINWYYFRTNVGGSFVLPKNITIILASNYEFPANIISRGQSFTFPRFDEIRCKEMIEDYLKTYNIRKPNENLISVIASDYVEEFAQKIFDELSPRSLVRYLDRYEKDMKKRKRTLELSKEEIIPQPDPECFFDMNLKLMRALYGEKALEQLQEEHLAKYL